MKLLPLLFLSLCLNDVSAQTDTVRIDLEHSVISLHKCKGLLFGQHLFNGFTYPPMDKATTPDSSFIFNRKIIFFQICKNGRVRIEGFKNPEAEASGEISFYRKGRLIRTEFWTDDYTIDDEKGNSFSTGDEAKWISKKVYRNGKLIKETSVILEFDGPDYCATTKKIKRAKTKTLRRDCYQM